ncbi:copper resistance D family protein [Modestobacter roseus]|uniref:copper resistance D family protein n=1 Tax=Modestobacter roseus TaxID=1181884 RepID=UPI0034DFA4DB
MTRAALVAPVESGRPSEPVRPPWLVPAVLGTGIGAVVLLLAGLAVGGGSTGPSAGGPVVAWGEPVLTLASRVAAVGTVGTALFAAALLPGRAGALAPAARRAVLAASGWAAVWAAATALGGLLTLSRLVDVAPWALPWSSVPLFLGTTGAGQAVLLGTAAAGLLTVTARRCTRVAGARLLLAGALAVLLLPVLLTGHSSAADDHLLTVATLGVHVVAAALWIGGLLALLVHGRAPGAAAPAVARFSRLALVCAVVTGGSGLLAAGLLLGDVPAVPAALGTGYGWLLIGKTAGLAALVVLGHQHRRRTLPRLREGRPGAFRRFAAVELVVMVATVALAVALAASPPPATASSQPAGTAAPAAPVAGADPMAGHDHGELSVGVLVDAERFHVAGPVAAGSRVTVSNGSDQPVTITAAEGAFDVDVPARTLLTFLAPEQAGEYPFRSRHSSAFTDVLVVE